MTALISKYTFLDGAPVGDTFSMPAVRSDGEALLVAVLGTYPYGPAQDTAGVIWDAAGDNQQFTLLKSSAIDGNRSFSVYVLENPTTSKTGNIDLKFVNSANLGAAILAMHVKNFKPGQMITASSVNSKYPFIFGSNVSDTIASAVGDLVVDFFGARITSAGSAPVAGQGNISRNGVGYSMSASSKPGAANVTMGWAMGQGEGTHIDNTHIMIAIASAPVAITPPDAPTIGAVTGISGSEVSVNGTPPVNNGGSPITSYTATSTPYGFTATSPTLPVLVGGLIPNASYTFRLHANNSVGSSSESAASNSIIPSSNQPPAFGGTVANISGTAGAALPTSDVHTLFTDADALVYSASPGGAAWPAGLVINASTGVRSGNVAVAGTYTGLKVRATDTENHFVDSNAFNVVIAPIPSATLDGSFTVPKKFFNIQHGDWLGTNLRVTALDISTDSPVGTIASVTTDPVTARLPTFTIPNTVAGTVYALKATDVTDPRRVALWTQVAA